MTDVFISFAPEDRGWASGLAAALSAAGLDVTWDLAPTLGQAVQRDIENELATAKAIVAVWSNASRNSNWVRDVAQEALDRGVLLPVLKDIDRPPLGFRQLRCADLRGWTGGPTGLDEVINQLRVQVGLEPAPAVPQPTADELDFERSTIILKSRIEDFSVGATPSKGNVTVPSVAPTAPSVSGKVVSALMPGRAGPGDLRPGDEIGQYRIVRRLGAGGFGAVYEAANIHNEDERVAMKLLLADIAESDRFAQLLKLEANALLRLKHPAVVQYRVFGRIADSDQFYLVTEFVPGPTLRDWRRAHTPTVDEARTLAIRLAQGLAAAHRRGIVHRDLAPDNVIVTSDDLSEATLIDFGIARLAEGDALGGAFAGKFSYAAPEQFDADGGRLGPSIDIYAFGLLIAAFVRGKPIDMGRDMEAARAKRQAVPPLDDIPEALRPALTKLLQPDPTDRPQNMDEVALLFERHKDVVAPAVVEPAVPPAPTVLPAGPELPDQVTEPSSSIAVSVPSLVVAKPVLVEEAKAAPAVDVPPKAPEPNVAPPPPAVEKIVAPVVVKPPPSPPPARPVKPPKRPQVVVVDRPDGELEDEEPTERRRRFGSVQLVAVALLGAVATFMLWPREEAPTPAPGPVVEAPPTPPKPQPEPPKPEPPKPEPPKPEPIPTPPVPAPQPEPPKPEPTPQPPKPEPQPEPPKPEPQPEPPKPEPVPPTPEPEPPKPEPEPVPQPEPPKPEVHVATGQIEPAPPGSSAQKATGTVYGKENKDARIVFIARGETTLTVKTGKKLNKIAIDRTLKKGESYRLPNRTDLAVSASDAGALDVILDEVFIGRAGKDGYALQDFKATPQGYGGPAELPKPEPEPQPEPQPEPPKPEPQPEPEPPKPPVSTSEDAGAVQTAGLAALNALRAAAGAPALKANNKLQGVAAQIVANHAAANAFVPPSSNQVLQMLIASGYGSAKAYPSGTRKKKSVTAAVQEYWSSDANVVDPSYVAAGIAMARAADGTPYYELVLAGPP